MSEHRKSLPRVFFATRASPCTPASFISARLWFQLNEHILNSDLPLFRQWTPARHHLLHKCTNTAQQLTAHAHLHTSAAAHERSDRSRLPFRHGSALLPAEGSLLFAHRESGAHQQLSAEVLPEARHSTAASSHLEAPCPGSSALPACTRQLKHNTKRFCARCPSRPAI